MKCILLPLNLIIPVVLAVTDDTTLPLDVVNWVREHGGYFNSKQEIRRAIPGDVSLPIGVFARQRIERGELLTMVPWKCIMTAGTDTWETGIFCDTIQFIIDEMHKGEDSFYGPYVKYLLAMPPVDLPSTWSQEGKKLLRTVIGYNSELPPDDVDTWVDDWKLACNGSDDPFEIQAAMMLTTRGDDDILTPVYDMYNHRNGKWFNAESYHVHGVKHEMKASRAIEAGEEIYISYDLCVDCYNKYYNYGTPEMFRDFGFIEQYPQRWIFHKQRFGFDIDKNDNGVLNVTWLDANLDPHFGALLMVRKESILFLISQLKRLRKVNKMLLQPLLQSTDDETVPRHELDMTFKYFQALATAMTKAAKAAKNLGHPSIDDDGKEQINTAKASDTATGLGKDNAKVVHDDQREREAVGSNCPADM